MDHIPKVSNNKPHMKYLSVDLGTRRTGLAISDDKGIIAQPFKIIERKSDSQLVAEISEICTQKRIDMIILGIPFSSHQEIQDAYRKFGQKIARKTGLPLQEWDETFSTKQAQNMVAFADQPTERKKTRTHRDSVAAAVILQEYLDNEERH